MSHPEEERPEDAQPQAEGSEAQSSDPTSANGADGDELTVEDILAEEQTAEARAADGAEDEEDTADSGDADADAEAAAKAGQDPDQGENPYLEDLRRLTAEYANYRRRTEENAELERNRQAARVMTPLLSVLDDLNRAEAHGDLEEGSAFASIAHKLRETLTKLGLESFGEKGENFDPAQHEAIAQVPMPGAEPGSVIDVVEKGYRLGELELRPAKVAVAIDPEA